MPVSLKHTIRKPPFQPPFTGQREWDYNNPVRIQRGQVEHLDQRTIACRIENDHLIATAQAAPRGWWQRLQMRMGKTMPREVFQVSHPSDCTKDCDYAKAGWKHFHGRPSTRVFSREIDWPPPEQLEQEFGPFDAYLPSDLTVLGQLREIGYQDAQTLRYQLLTFKKPFPMLATDYLEPGYESLFIVGGDYRVAPRPGLICGPLLYVVYRTIKRFDDYSKSDYHHDFSDPKATVAHSADGRQLYILRGESQFRIDDSQPMSLGIDG